MTNTNFQSAKDPRHEQLHRWLEAVISEPLFLADSLNTTSSPLSFRIESLAGDASFRRYHRIYVENDDNSHVYMLMDAPPEKESIIEFVEVAELMADKVNVPDIIAKNIEEGFLLLQDFGNVEFAHALLDKSQAEIDGYYQQAMQVLQDIQSISLEQGRQLSLPEYDRALLMQEMALFVDWFLPYYNVPVTEEFLQLWQNFTGLLLANIEQQPQVIVHRDFHSRNLMLDRDLIDNPLQPLLDIEQNILGVIDFQDVVIGAYSYDIVSLLRDAYVNWSDEQIDQWLMDFYQRLPIEIRQERDYPQFYQDVIIMGVQRHLKVLGIFVRLSERDGKTRYLADIPKVMADLLYELSWLAESPQADGDIQVLAREFLAWVGAEVLPNLSV